jgi:hypothetical protein
MAAGIPVNVAAHTISQVHLNSQCGTIHTHQITWRASSLFTAMVQLRFVC